VIGWIARGSAHGIGNRGVLGQCLAQGNCDVS
jgi:hypothetical protein